MDEDIAARIGRIEEAQRATATALQVQGEGIEIIIRHLAEIIELLTPKEPGTPLDELLAHMIKQNSEQLRLTHDLVEAMNRIEHELPAKVVAALKAAGRPDDAQG